MLLWISQISRSGSRTTADFKGFLHLPHSKYGILAFLLSFFRLEKKPPTSLWNKTYVFLFQNQITKYIWLISHIQNGANEGSLWNQQLYVTRSERIEIFRKILFLYGFNKYHCPSPAHYMLLLGINVFDFKAKGIARSFSRYLFLVLAAKRLVLSKKFNSQTLL